LATDPVSIWSIRKIPVFRYRRRMACRWQAHEFGRFLQTAALGPSIHHIIPPTFPRPRNRRAPNWPRRYDLIAAVEQTYIFMLSLGSAWETVPGVARLRLLDKAHELGDLIGSAEDGRGGKRLAGHRKRNVVLRHPHADLDALGAP
jgi:hypothetical protein